MKGLLVALVLGEMVVMVVMVAVVQGGVEVREGEEVPDVGCPEVEVVHPLEVGDREEAADLVMLLHRPHPKTLTAKVC